MFPVRITRIHCAVSFPRVGCPGHLFLIPWARWDATLVGHMRGIPQTRVSKTLASTSEESGVQGCLRTGRRARVRFRLTVRLMLYELRLRFRLRLRPSHWIFLAGDLTRGLQGLGLGSRSGVRPMSSGLGLGLDPAPGRRTLFGTERVRPIHAVRVHFQARYGQSANIHKLKISEADCLGRFLVDLEIPPLEIKNPLGSKPWNSRLHIS